MSRVVADVYHLRRVRSGGSTHRRVEIRGGLLRHSVAVRVHLEGELAGEAAAFGAAVAVGGEAQRPSLAQGGQRRQRVGERPGQREAAGEEHRADLVQVGTEPGPLQRPGQSGPPDLGHRRGGQVTEDRTPVRFQVCESDLDRRRGEPPHLRQYDLQPGVTAGRRSTRVSSTSNTTVVSMPDSLSPQGAR